MPGIAARLCSDKLIIKRKVEKRNDEKREKPKKISHKDPIRPHTKTQEEEEEELTQRHEDIKKKWRNSPQYDTGEEGREKIEPVRFFV